MPHSGGGGSSGGGFHSGGSSGSSNHVSSHYFPGARRYRKYYTDGRPDEYVYANSKPGKTSLSSLIIITIMGLIFILASGFAVYSDKPRFIVPKYSDEPAIHDLIGAIDDREELLELMKSITRRREYAPLSIRYSMRNGTAITKISRNMLTTNTCPVSATNSIT